MAAKIITQIAVIEQLAARNERSNFQFRKWVKGSDLEDEGLDDLVQQTADEVAAQIDCTACGNCCRTLQVVVDDQDIRRLAKSLSLSPQELERRYVRKAPDGVKHMASTPCPFLEGNRCSVYEDRPKACRDFPYLQAERFRDRMLMMIDNCGRCPIVFNTYERLQTELGFKKGRRG